MMNEENSAKAKTTELSKFPDWLDKNLIKHFVIPALGMMMVFTVFWYFKEQIYIVFDIDTYLSWHNILEFSSVVVSIIIFLISWYSYKQTGNQRELFLGTAFLVVGVIDFMHTLSFPGMPAFISQNTTNKAIDYWIVARLIQAAALTGSGFISTRQQFHRFIRAKLLMGALFLIIATFYVITYLPHLIPEMFVPGEGLTPTKIWLEYSVVFIILLAIGKYILIYRQTRTSMVRTLLLGLMFFVFSELSFTLYASAFDIYNLLGHVFKTGTMILIFQGLFVSSVQEPFIRLKLAEDIVRIERDNLKNIFEAIEDGVYIVNQQYDIQYVNPVLVKDFGPFEGRKCYAYFHDREDICPWCKIADILEGKTVRWEWQSLKNQKTYDLIDTPLKNPDGSISKLEIFRDITERVRVEQKLVNSKNLLNATQRIAGVGGWMWNAENKSMFWTDETYRIHEIDPLEIEAGSNEHIERGAECYDEKDRPIILDAFQKCADEGMPYDLVFPFTTVKGNRIWIRTAAQAEEENGEVVRVIGNIIDITERVQAEENLVKEKEFSEKLIDTSKAIIVGLDKNHKIQLFNKGAEKITGYKRTNVLGKDWFKEFFPAGLHNEMEEVWKDSWGQKMHSYINPIITKNGAERIISWQTTGFYEGDDEKNHLLLSIGEDITERKIAEDELSKSRQQLRELTRYLQDAREEERTHMAREIHDELGQMLTALTMDLAWMSKRLPPDTPILAEKIIMMTKLVNETIQMVQRIATELRPGLLDDLGLTAALEWQTQEFAERSEITCELHVPEDAITLNRDLDTTLFRIFQETLSNIARHANATSVRVELEADPDEVTLTIQDDGVGITDSKLTDTTSLGLIGVRERARFNGGEVTIQGIPDQGTTVVVRIPRLSEDGSRK